MCVCAHAQRIAFLFYHLADVIQLHSPKIEASSQQQHQQEIEDIVMDEESHHVDDNPEKL